MRTIDLSTWPRRKHFEVFSGFDYPHINLCANVEITALRAFVKQRSLSLNITLVYLFARVANAIPEFRYRVREGKVVEHDVVHPSSTIMTEGESVLLLHDSLRRRLRRVCAAGRRRHRANEAAAATGRRTRSG